MQPLWKGSLCIACQAAHVQEQILEEVDTRKRSWAAYGPIVWRSVVEAPERMQHRKRILATGIVEGSIAVFRVVRRSRFLSLRMVSPFSHRGAVDCFAGIDGRPLSTQLGLRQGIRRCAKDSGN